MRRASLLLWTVTMLVALIASGVSMSVRRRGALLLLDPAVAADGPIWIGAASTAGVIGWSVSATALLIAGVMIRQQGRDPPRARLFLEGGAMVGVLAVDDAFLVHEHWLAVRLGVPDTITYAAYGLIVVAIGVRHRSVLRSFDAPPYIACGLAFTSSMVLDLVFHGSETRASTALEDIPKLWAITLFAAVTIRDAIRSMLGTSPTQSSVRRRSGR